MTNEKIIAALYDIAQGMDTYDEKFFKRMVKETSYSDAISLDICKVAGLIHDLQEDIYKEEAQKSGRTSALRAAKRILAAYTGTHKQYRFAQEEDGFQYFCSGYHAVGFTMENKLPFESCDTSDYDYSKFDFERRLFSNVKRNDEIQLPTIAELKAYIKIKKTDAKVRRIKNAKVSFDFGYDYLYFNAEYLLDIMECLPTAKAYVNGKRGLNGLVFFDEKGNRGIILPCHIPNSKQNEERERSIPISEA